MIESSTRQVADVHDHSQALHLGHRFHAERAEPGAGGGFASAVREHSAAVPRQRHAPHAETPEGLYHAKAMADGFRALDSQQQRDTARVERTLEVLSRLDNYHVDRVRLGYASRLLKKQERSSQRALAHVLIFGEDSEELECHVSGAQSRQPEVAEGVALPSFSLVHHCEQQVVVSVGYSHRGLPAVRSAGCSRGLEYYEPSGPTAFTMTLHLPPGA